MSAAQEQKKNAGKKQLPYFTLPSFMLNAQLSPSQLNGWAYSSQVLSLYAFLWYCSNLQHLEEAVPSLRTVDMRALGVAN